MRGAAETRDRLGRTYGLRLGPDELVTADPDGSETLRRAVASLRRQPACSTSP